MDVELPLIAAAASRPLLAFGLTLLLLCLASGLAWYAVHAHARRAALGDAAPVVSVALLLVLAFGVVAFALTGFVQLAQRVGPEPLGMDVALSAALLEHTPFPALRAFAWVTRLANTSTLTVLGIGGVLVLAISGRRLLAVTWAAALGGNAVLNVSLKALFERVRPVHDASLIAADGWSFPSGHASGSVVAFGMLAYVLLRILPPRWHLSVVVGAVAAAFTVGSSRLFLQVHYLSDVAAGFASGGTWLLVCIATAEWWRRHPQR